MSSAGAQLEPFSACEKVMTDLYKLKMQNNDFERYVNAFLSLNLQLRSIGEPLSLNWQKFFLFGGLDDRAKQAKLDGQQPSVGIYQILANLQPIYQQTGSSTANPITVQPASQPASQPVSSANNRTNDTQSERRDAPNPVAQSKIGHKVTQPGRMLKVSWKKDNRSTSSLTDRIVKPNHQESKRSAARLAACRKRKLNEHSSDDQPETPPVRISSPLPTPMHLRNASNDATQAGQRPLAGSSVAATGAEDGAARARVMTNGSGKDETGSSRRPMNDGSNVKIYLQSSQGYVYEQFYPRSTVSRSGRRIKPKGQPFL